MKKILSLVGMAALVGSVSTAHANGFDLSGEVSMGLQATTINGETNVTPFTRVTGTASYTMETDIGVTFVLAVDFDMSNVERGPDPFLPGHR